MSALARCALCPRASAADTASPSSPPPRRDYAALFERGRSGGVPPLFLAPMEGLGDRRLRRALAFSTGGFDEACREFTRVPGVLSQGARPEKLLRGIALTGYDADELTDWTKFAWNEWDQDAVGTPPPTSRAPNLLAAQLMGSNEELLERCARFLANEGGAPRVDLNCGCPANVVTGKGAGSSLLRDPRDVESCAAAVARGVAGTGCAVTVKLRSGFDDRGLLRDNLLAAQEGGAEFITLHPRTRAQGYSGRADWDDIAFAADLLHIPVVGNGDVTSASLAAKMVRETGCTGVMIGRGAVQDPLVFRRCVAALSDDSFRMGNSTCEDPWDMSVEEEAEAIRGFLRRFADEVFGEAERQEKDGKRRRRRGRSVSEDCERFKVGKLKQVCKYLFAGNDALLPHVSTVLGMEVDLARGVDAAKLLRDVETLVSERWAPPNEVLVDAFSMRTSYQDSADAAEVAGRTAETGVGKDIVRT